MKHPWSVLSRAAALAIPLVGIGAFNLIADAQSAPALPPPLVQPPEGTQPQSPALPETPANAEDVALGTSYESLQAGVSFRPPSNCKRSSNEMGNSSYLAEWSDPAREWTLKLAEMKFENPTPLRSGINGLGKVTDGVLEQTVKNLQAQLPGCVILRQDVTNTRDPGRVDLHHPEYRDNVGLIAVRYTSKGRRRLSQQAIIQCDDRVYYLLTMTTPGSAAMDDKADNDPAEHVPADVFTRMIDSIHLIDRAAIKKDQDERLYHTRTAMVNWTPERLHRALLGQQWVRITRNGKDIGYSYITEEESGGIPKPLTAKQMQEARDQNKIIKPQDFKPAGDGILVGERGRMVTDGTRSDHTKGPIQTDSAFWFFISADKKHEDFSRVVVNDDHLTPKKGYIQEFGVSDRRVRRVVERHAIQDKNPGAIVVPDAQDGLDPNITVAFKEDWELNVSETTGVGAEDPLTRKLPPWYVPQALSHLLPRLLPLDHAQVYLFASYVSDAREVVMRYVDVLPEQVVTFAGRRIRVVPIHDRLGLAGSVTTHFMTIDGEYVGSENKDQKLVMIPTDEVTLLNIWKDANLTKPGAVNPAGTANADAVNPR